MRVFVNGEFVDIDIEATVTLGSVVDPRVVRIEQIIADHYDIIPNRLYDWDKNGEAKLLLCFLLYKYCNYSIGSIAHQYQIYKGFLRTCIKKELIRCLENKERLNFIESLIAKVDLNMSQAS